MTADIDQSIELAVSKLKAGLLVAFPTETVYGLGADASSAAALERLYAVKGRPTSHPVIVHIASVEQLTDWAKDIPPQAYQLAERFWPGPMTLILPKADHVLSQVTGGQDSVGIRIPSHPVALKLLRAFAGGLAAPSANRFGRLSPTSAQAVEAEFADSPDLPNEVAMVLDGGPCDVGIESTIISLLSPQAKILRPGMIDAASVAEVLGAEAFSSGSSASAGETRVPGALPSHYAPQTKLTVASSEQLIELVLELNATERSAAVFAFDSTVAKLRSNLSGLAFDSLVVAPEQVDQYARALYEQLRRFDKLKLDRIFVEAVPDGSAWDGVRDRLERASAEVSA
ncbi:threonylcarbamoyl-AMP synthase [bacterium]|nr:threonylcarbamoyl-AMP synthase [bacterium]MBP9808427.1 threonylcarbamoyl-AMP synthase [bacterium]